MTSSLQLCSPPGLVGRHREQSVVRRALRDSTVVTLTGPGGVGKTRLAELVADTPVCELVGARTLDQVVALLAETQSVSLGGSRDLEEALGRVADEARGLVVLDNAEHVLDEVRTVCDALRDAPGVAGILVTSRVRLGVAGEREVPLAGLDVPEGLMLLERNGATWSEGDDSDAEALVLALDGLPLALELAAWRLAWLRPRDVLAQLADPRLLTRTSEPGRHGGLERVLRWSWELLDAPQRQVLVQLSTFEGPFTLADAQQVVHVPGVDLVEAIHTLRAASMLAAGPRPRLLETVRRFARTQLQEDDEVWARHGSWATRGPADTTRLTGRQRGAHHRSVRARSLDLAAVQRRDPTLAAVASLQLAQAALLTLPVAAQLEVLDQGISARGTPEVHAWLLFRRGQALGRLGHSAAARRDLADAATLAEQHGAWSCWAWARRTSIIHSSDAPDVLDALERIRDRVRAEGLLGPWAMVEGALASVSRELGLHARSGEHIDQAIHLFERHEDPLNEAVARLKRAEIAADRTSLADARRALELFTAEGYAAGVPDARLAIGELLVRSSRLEEAEDELRTTIDEALRLDLPTTEALAWRSLGWIAIVQGRSAQGDRCLHSAHTLGLRARHPGVVADAELGWAVLELVDGELDAAARRLEALDHPWCPGLGAYWRLACEVLQGSESAAEALAGFDPGTIADGLGELHEVLLGLVALHRGELSEVRRRLDEPRSKVLAQLARTVLRSALQRSQRSAQVWVSRNGTSVVLPDGTQIDLTRRGVLRRILVQLVTRRLEAPGEPQSVDAVLGAGWPDEQMQHEAGVNRVYVSISRLRSAGLGPLVQQREGGYLLDPARPVSWREAR